MPCIPIDVVCVLDVRRVEHANLVGVSIIQQRHDLVIRHSGCSERLYKILLRCSLSAVSRLDHSLSDGFVVEGLRLEHSHASCLERLI